MKKLLALFICTTLLTFVSCEDEPLEGDFEVGGTSCEAAVANTAQAALNFLGVNDDNYTQLCTAYRNALSAQILICGDSDGSLQLAVDALGDCNNTVANDCDSAIEAVAAAQTAFENASEEDYTNICNAYKATLENQIIQCGDEDGSIQSTIDDLGNCTVTSSSDSLISLTAGTLPIEFDIVDVAIDGDLLKVTGQTSASNDYTIYFEVGQGQTGVDVINPAFELSLISVFFPSTQGFEDFTSTITVNTDGTLTGTFGGVVTNADGGDLNIAAGSINVSY